MRRFAIALLLAPLSLLAPPALAFSSITLPEAALNLLVPGRAESPRVEHGYHHAEITRAGLEGLGLSERGLRRVMTWNFLVDWHQYAHTLAHPPTPRYRPGDHFDRNEGETSATAVARGLKTLAERRREAIAALSGREDADERAMTLLAEALHAVQDVCSHSNLIDLAPGDRRAFLAQLAGRPGRPPQSLRLTGTSRRKLADLAADDDLEPGFGHDRMSKDDARANPEARTVMADGRTKYEAAKALATETTRAFALSLRAQVPPARWQRALTRLDAPTPH